uniref:NADH:ubiquinone reductase (H(+)-translocating) n=1 Tax=Cephalodiscus hodgsoni TaxID=560606 RepID=A0A481P861_9BILA|nr:NADH dehydrogenase subunit 5 [Cephalodiscus hodgsoni]
MMGLGYLGEGVLVSCMIVQFFLLGGAGVVYYFGFSGKKWLWGSWFIGLFGVFYFWGRVGKVIVGWDWVFWSEVCSYEVSVCFDFFSGGFMCVLGYIGVNILGYSEVYMSSDKNLSKFLFLMVLFLFVMGGLSISWSLVLLFFCWEGVGVISFVLIMWYYERKLAGVSARQAMIYNGLATFGLFLVLGGGKWSGGGWCLLLVGFCYVPWCFMVSGGTFLGAWGKSSQFGFHSWLPAAMEGPTPVSSLLHSSTMVVAGVYLLIRFSDFIGLYFSGFCIFLGAVTAFYGSFFAFFQKDFKKVVAFSTTSQLGVMVVGVGLGFPEVAFFHLCVHGLFKAMLFLVSGVFIHGSSDDQDFRKLWGLGIKLLGFFQCLVVGVLSLGGWIFSSGFFSKDVILEGGFVGGVGGLVLWLFIGSFVFTVSYGYKFYVLFSGSISKGGGGGGGGSMGVYIWSLSLGVVGSVGFIVGFCSIFELQFSFLHKAVLGFVYVCGGLFFFGGGVGVVSKFGKGCIYWGDVVHKFFGCGGWGVVEFIFGVFLIVVCFLLKVVKGWGVLWWGKFKN